MMMQLWKILSEVFVTTDDTPPQTVVGFMNIVTWVDSADVAAGKISSYFESFGWRLIEIQEATVIDSDFVADDDQFQDVIERARSNPHAIIFGTLHTYKPN